jgi:hypothetical protein
MSEYQEMRKKEVRREKNNKPRIPPGPVSVVSLHTQLEAYAAVEKRLWNKIKVEEL